MERRIDAVASPEPGTPSAIMPELPASSAPAPSAEDRLVVLLASAAQEGGRLSPSAWKTASDAFAEVFSPDGLEEMTANARMKAEHAFFVLQTHFHAALLQPPLSASQLAADGRLAEDIAALPGDRAERFLSALQELSPELFSSLIQSLPSDDGKHAGRGRLAEAMRRSARFLSGAGMWESVFGEEDGEKDERNVAMENGVAVPRRRARNFMPAPLKKQLDALTSAVAEAGSACSGMAGSVAQAAVNQYQGAARYLRELSAQRRLSLLRPRRGAMELAPEFAGAGSAAEALEKAALEAGCLGSARALEDLRRLMAEQPFTLVAVGEGKRGKSTLINALLGRAASPVRESAPETASVARFRWGRDFRGMVHFFDDEECRQIGEFLKPSSIDETFTERVRLMLEERPPQECRELDGEEALRSFLSAEGQGAVFTARVEVELPSESLRHGLVLVDTPGLNATDPVQNYLAFEECLAADCLLFVMDARRPESASEQELIRQLAHSGRAASVIGVLTGADRLNDEASLEDAMARARLLMDSAEAAGMDVLGLLEVNAREAMEQRCSGTGDGGANFRELCRIIEEASRRKQESDEGRAQRVRAKGMELVGAVRRDAGAFLAAELAELPDQSHADILRRHAARLESVMESCSSQAWAVVNSAELDLRAWRKEQGRALDSWQERTLLRIMDAANKHADSLGLAGMFKPKNWKGFDEQEVPRIARECLEELLAERRDLQRDWNEKLKQFGERMHEISVLCLDAVVVDDLELQSISDVPFSRERWLVNANSIMKKLGLVAMGLAIRRGGGVGLGIVLGNMGWWALLPAAVLGSVVWTLMKLGSPSRCRRLLMERKEEAVRRWASEQRKRLDELLNQNLEEVSQAYGRAVSEGFVPALSVLAEEASALRVYLDVLDKMRAGAEGQAAALLGGAERLEAELAEAGAGREG